MLCSVAFIIATFSFATFFSWFLVCSAVHQHNSLPPVIEQSCIIEYGDKLLKAVVEVCIWWGDLKDFPSFMFLHQSVVPLDLVNSSNYWKPLYPFVFSVIIVSFGLVWVLVCCCCCCAQSIIRLKLIFFVFRGIGIELLYIFFRFSPSVMGWQLLLTTSQDVW